MPSSFSRSERILILASRLFGPLSFEFGTLSFPFGTLSFPFRTLKFEFLEFLPHFQIS